MNKLIGLILLSLFLICLTAVTTILFMGYMDTHRQRREDNSFLNYYDIAFSKVQRYRIQHGTWPALVIKEGKGGLVVTAAELELMGPRGRTLGYFLDSENVYLYLSINTYLFEDMETDKVLGHLQDGGVTLLKRNAYDPTNGAGSIGVRIRTYARGDLP